MDATALREVLELYAPRVIDGDYGRTWGTPQRYTVVRGAVAILSGRELERAKSFGPQASVKITTRYRPDVTSAHEARWNGRRLLINAVLPDARRTELVIYATDLGA